MFLSADNLDCLDDCDIDSGENKDDECAPQSSVRHPIELR